MKDPVKIGIVSISDRASSGTYEDKGLPALKEWLTSALENDIILSHTSFRTKSRSSVKPCWPAYMRAALWY